jgi:hypothetical protein
MKKIIVAAFLTATGFAITAFMAPKASDSYNFEGVITYAVTVNNPRAGQVNKKENNTLFYIKGSKMKTVIGGGAFVNTTIADCNDPGNITLLMDFKGSKYSIKPDKTKLPDPVVKYTGGTKTIAGYACHEAEITEYKTQTLTTVEDVYYTEDISAGTCALQFKGLKGFPLEWTTVKSADNPNAITSDAIAISVEKKSLSDDEFAIPPGYKQVTQAEMAQDIQNSAGKGK